MQFDDMGQHWDTLALSGNDFVLDGRTWEGKDIMNATKKNV